RAGYGYARRDYDYGQKAQYVLAEQAARRERLGLWKNEEFVPPPPVEPIVVASKLPSLRVLSPKHYSEEYKRGLYRSIKTRKSMHARTLAARNGRSVDQPSRTGSFDFAGEEEAPAGIDAANQPRREAAAAADPALEERFSFPEKEKEDGFKEIRRQQAEIEDLKRQLETAKRVIRGK
ncbi:MAG: hypothetical protein K2Q23_12690, partial [Bryobacteraceae bacterium]|nr:hypothetical protein [Bryobacteraceae bacterium]